MTKWICLPVLAIGCVYALAMARAEDPASDANRAKQVNRQDAKSELDEQAEKAVFEFVKEHQPEMADLLTFLKKKKSKDYHEAMRESRKVRERLMSIKDRDPEMYTVELAVWKNSAQIRLLAAAASAKGKLGEEDRAKLEELIKHENELNIQRLTLEKARLESRLQQLSQQLSRREEQADSVVTKSLKVWEARIQRSGAKSKKKESAP